MWIEMFSVVAAIAIGSAVMAVIMESPAKKRPRRVRVSVFR
jgi:hypothetical protein